MAEHQMTADLVRRLRAWADTGEGDENAPLLAREAADELDSLRDTLQKVMDQKSRGEVASGHQISEMAARLAAAERDLSAIFKAWNEGKTLEEIGKVVNLIALRSEKAYSGGVDINVALALGVSTSADLYSLKQTAETYKSSGEMKGSDNAADPTKEKPNG